MRFVRQDFEKSIAEIIDYDLITKQISSQFMEHVYFLVLGQPENLFGVHNRTNHKPHGMKYIFELEELLGPRKYEIDGDILSIEANEMIYAQPTSDAFWEIKIRSLGSDHETVLARYTARLSFYNKYLDTIFLF